MTGSRRHWVHLYEFGIGGEPFADAWDVLSDAERARARCVADPARRRRFVARRAALHEILDRYPAGVCFNSSHSGDVAAVAVAPRPVGVDIEIDTPRRSADRVAQRMFAPDERSILDMAGGEARRRLFYRCWVAKEAYAKARRRGLAMRFDEFSVAPALCSEDGTGHVAQGWTVSLKTRGDRHVAVAVQGEDWEVLEVSRG
jgi:4'-phosphopantetheinyl transferase